MILGVVMVVARKCVDTDGNRTDVVVVVVVKGTKACVPTREAAIIHKRDWNIISTRHLCNTAI